MDMADKKDEKKAKTKMIDPKESNVRFVPPGTFRPYSKDQQLGKKPSKATKGGRR